LPLAGLFSRIDDDELLQQPNRMRLLGPSCGPTPASTCNSWRGRPDWPRHPSTTTCASWRAAGLIVVKAREGLRLPASERRRGPPPYEAAPVLRSGGGRAVLREAAKRPAPPAATLADELGLAPSTVPTT